LGPRLLFVFINSVYSFYWDVARDWSLTLLSRRRGAPDQPFGLRRHRYITVTELYYFAIVLDLLLRFTWSLKLSPHLDHFNDMEGGIFVVELLELFRRWIWVFLRVESEWSESFTLVMSRLTTAVRHHPGPAQDDILLGDYGAHG
jgi:EXS family